MMINPDFDKVRQIITGLDRNTYLWGKPYCPCKIQHTPENICPCVDMMEKKECKCGLYVARR